MSSPMHRGVPSKGSPAESWWEHPALRTGGFTKNKFVASVLEHWADQNEPAGSNPPAWGDLYRPTRPHHQPQPAANGRPNFQDGVMTRKGDGRETWVPDSGTPESTQAAVSSVVNVPKETKSLADPPKYKAKMGGIFKVFGDVLSGKPCQNPPVRGAFREAPIPLKQGYRPRGHRDFQIKGEREQVMIKNVKEFIERGWIEPCSRDWVSPCFVVLKKVAGEWRLVLDYRDLNLEPQHDAYSLPSIDNLLQKQRGKRVFSVLDLNHGYHQMPVANSSQDATAMTTPLGLMHWKVMPMGLKNGNA